MKILVKRLWKKNRYTIGRMFINNLLICNTLEDKDRLLTNEMSLSEIKKRKVLNETAIPTGTYKVTLDIFSPKFGSMPFYKEVCNGKLPRLLNVPGFEGILIHVGEGSKGPDLTSGCILVGDNTIVGGLTNSKETFKKIYNMLLQDPNNIEITIE